MSTFRRRFSDESIKKLKNEEIFKHKLLPDIKSGDVFPAIRNEMVDFYYKGGGLFRYKGNDFSTHVKYAVGIEVRAKEEYITEAAFKQKKRVPDFSEGYDAIKENCGLHSDVEAKGIAEIYRKYSYFSGRCVCVLDIEVAFEKLNDGITQKCKGTDRIDLLLFNTKTCQLLFVEAKDYSNGEIVSETTPKVVKQVERYEKQIKAREQGILEAYQEYVRAINTIFGLRLPEPQKIIPDVILLVFGFDDDQKNGRLKERVTSNKNYAGKRVYCCGKAKNIDLETVWKCKEQQ